MMRHDRGQPSFVSLVAALCVYLSLSKGVSNCMHDDITVCDGSVASFNWPCDLQYDSVKVMTLTFDGFSSHGWPLASIFGNGSVIASKDYFNRVKARGTSGISLDRVGIQDTGVYITKAEFQNGTHMERRFTLNVHVPPLVAEDTLRLNVVNTSRKCQKIICGKIVFPGFPAVSLEWNIPKGPGIDDRSHHVSSVESCPLVSGNYTCRMTGPALLCGQQYNMYTSTSLTISILPSSQSVKETAAIEAEMKQKELVLSITLPIVAVMTPMVILGLWLLWHLLSDRCKDSSRKDQEAGFSSSSTARAPPKGAVLLGLSSPSTSETVPLTCAAENQSGGEEEEEKDKVAMATAADSDGVDIDPTDLLIVPESILSSLIADDGLPVDETRL